MSIDLTRVFKTEESATKPFVSALVVLAQPDDERTNAVRDLLKAEGFVVDRVQKSEKGDTVSYVQGDQPAEVQIVRLGDNVLASVGGLSMPEGWMSEVIDNYGFFPDLQMATAALYDQLEAVTKSDTPQDDAEAVLTGFAEYLNQIIVLPAACFKLDAAITELVQKNETEEEKKARVKKHPPSEMAPADEEDDQKPPPEEVTKAEVKVDDTKPDTTPTAITEMQTALFAALKGMEERTTAQLTGLTQKVEAVVSEQAEQKKTLDGVVQKADTLSTTLKTTVTAAPASDDRPAGPRMRVEKKDEDPRTGNFDTAFLRRRRS